MKIDTFTKSIFMKNNSILRTFFFICCIGIFTVSAQEKKDSIQEINTMLIQPNILKKGDTIAIVATAGILKNREEAIEKAKLLVEKWGLHVVVGKHVFNQNNHFAGTDEERVEDMQSALDNPKIKAIWVARGGYGTVRILDQLDFTKFKEHPKWIIGYSDVTALHSHMQTLGFETIHAMMPTSLEEDPEELVETIKTFKKTLFGKKITYKIPSNLLNKQGEVEGELVGGNLTLLLTMLGSKSSISTDGKILFIEEIGEYKYHIDRMLQSLKRAGYFEKCKGIVVGNMTKIKKNTTSWGASIEQLILDVVAEYNFPVLFDFPAGHEANNNALILGRKVKLKVKKTTSELDFFKK